MIVFIKAEGGASLCMVDLNELLLWNHKHQREEKNERLNASHIVADPTARAISPSEIADKLGNGWCLKL